LSLVKGHSKDINIIVKINNKREELAKLKVKIIR